MGQAQTDLEGVSRLVSIVERCARQSLADFVTDHRSAGYQLGGAGVVVGSVIDPDRIANPHIRAHASEGRLFRRVVEDAVRECGLDCTTFLERSVFPRAAAALGRSEAEVRRTVTELGRSLGGPWRADEKTAALAAWMVLAGVPSRHGT